MASTKKSINLLPDYFKTDKNLKFLSGTMDQLISTPDLERIDGYVGSKITPNYNPTTDFYLKESLQLRKNYSLEPAMVFKDTNLNITDVVSYDDLINELQTQGSNVSNLDSLLRSNFYSYDPFIDWDKLINYNKYYWLFDGPAPVLIDTENLNVETEILGQSSYEMSYINPDTDSPYSFTNGLTIVFSNNTVQTEYHGKTYIVEGVGSSIKLVDVNLLTGYELMAKVYNETFDSDKFDEYPFDGDKRLPLDPEYITINKSSKDLNPWSRYNRWFHEEVIEMSARINGVTPVYPLIYRAKRPIIEFNANIQLYNFGNVGIKNIDLIDTTPSDALSVVHGSFGYYVDGILLQSGHRVVFNNDIRDDVKGKIFKVSYTTGVSPILQLTEDLEPADLNSSAVNFGNKFAGTSWYFDESANNWVYSQQHNALNQPPLFDLFNNEGISYTKNESINNFVGNKIFGYDIGTGSNDSVLGFPLKYQNSIGVGSYLFKNYFMTDTITLVDTNISKTLSTSVTFLKINNDTDSTYTLSNVWKEAVNYQIPILEIQTVTENTSTLILSCLDKPIDTSLSVSAYINNVRIPAAINATQSQVSLQFSNELLKNQTVLLKIVTNQKPNDNGYYETPLGLTNNPLNGSISDMTLSELSDHVSTMVGSLENYTGTNLRDFSNYGINGSRLIINSNPISFSKIFLGKKEHNVVDAIRQASYHYNQFKSNLLRKLVNVDNQSTPCDALDIILKEINVTRDSKSPYYRSDMLGFGQNAVVRSYKVTDVDQIEYAVGFDFDLTRLSYKSVLVYINNNQLVEGDDYTFNYVDGSLSISATLEIDDIIEIRTYSDTLGCYIPPTPSKLGLYPKFKPEIYSDDSYIDGPVQVIKGHDGSIMKSYGDYRDAIILEFEKRIFNNIKVSYNSEIFDMVSVMPGAFRENKFTIQDANDILIEDYTRWAGLNGIDTITNSVYDEGNPYTWNYVNSVDILLGKSTSGYWRGLYKYYFDTDRPHTHPWEMLGYIDKPTWWDEHYSWIPGTKRTALIDAITNGKTKEPPTTDINLNYARPGFSTINPVDNSGNLKSPNECLVGASSYYDQKSSWAFGDHSPAETAWRRSSYWPFVVNIFSALSDPCSYMSKLYDVSRTAINSLKQITYIDDDLYLDPRKLLIDGENGNQIAGFGVYIVERGKQKDQNYIEKLREDIDYLDFNLFHKLGGFASKEKLQITIDSIDPISTSPGVILPPEDYSLILNTSNPIKSARISGIIIQKSNGNFLIKGYDVANPYFEIYRPIKTAISGVVTVGGISESFTEWSGVTGNGSTGLSNVDTVTSASATTRYYRQGQLVRYNNRYYRVKINHTAESTFNTTYFQLLSELPIKGGVTVQLPSKFENTVTRISYGTEFSTVQDVYDVIVGYGAWLEEQGFLFNEHNGDLGEVLNWKFTGKEFLYWTTQNWSDNNLITLSPFANKIQYKFIDSIVDNISSGNYEYNLLKADGKLFPIEKFKLTRDDGICSIDTINTEEGLFFAELNLIQKEHALVFNNSTVFNDTIYDSESGYKQRRIKLSGFRTKNWNGDLYSPGFVYDSVKITDWKTYKNYLPGEVVRYNGSYYQSLVKIIGDAKFEFSKWSKLSEKPIPDLIPNFDYKINQFEDFYSLDIDNFDYAQQQLAQHLLGYTPRTYLNNIFTNPISQYKFYQGFIKDKGTKNAIDKLSKASQSVNKGAVEFNEEWAFRVGHYGGFESYTEIEFPLTEGTSLENPYLVKFVDSIPTNSDPLTNYVKPEDCLLTPEDYISSATFITTADTWSENNIELTTAGYVSIDDVTTTAYNKNSILDIANNSIIQNGNTFWVGFLENGEWAVYRYSLKSAKISGVFVSSPGIDITFVTDSHHGLSIGDIVSVVNFNNQVNGVYIVSGIPSISQFTVQSTLTTIENEELLAYGALFKFDNIRFTDFAELSNFTDLLKFHESDKFWIDQGLGGKWQVYEKIKNYSARYIESNDYILGQQLGYSVYASDNTPVMMVSAPNWVSTGTSSWGRIKAYRNIDGNYKKDFEHTLNSHEKTYCSSSTSAEFGYSLAYDIGKQLYIAGAPAASNIKATVSSGTVILTTGTAVAKAFASEGLVKISSNNDKFDEETTVAVLVNPYGHATGYATHSRFGHSIYTNQVSSSTSTLMLVSSPGDSISASTLTGEVYAYLIDTSTTTNIAISVHPSGLKVLSTSSISLSVGDKWGYKISGNYSGSYIAISAPGYATTNVSGMVQIFGNNNNVLTHKQTILSPLGNTGNFGSDVVMSDSGNYLVISAPTYKVSNEPYGKVLIYKLGTSGQYSLWQTLSNPVLSEDLKFGTSVSINKDEDTLVISSLGTNRSKIAQFDAKTEVTTFDNNITTFIDPILDSGEVYVFDRLGEYFIPADELSNDAVLEGSKFGNAVVSTNNAIFVGAPSTTDTDYPDTSKLFVFDRIDKSADSWKLLHEQSDCVDTLKIKRIALIDSVDEQIVEYLDIIDPLKGKIAGIAAQELKFRSAFDPAIYSIGRAGTVNDLESNWIDEHVGELWWDLSTAKYMWYEQGSDIFRKNNWGRLFPGATIDVYEWVKSDRLPSEWAAIADTTEGLTNGISGQPKYPDNSIISVKQIYNNVTNSFENVYYFWVKNKVTLPSLKNRRISSYQVASIIADPVSNGLKFAEILSANSLAFANVQPMLNGNRISANIAIDRINNNIPRHTEWLLLNEGVETSVPSVLLEKKLIDSLLGHDSIGNLVPAIGLTDRNRYGIGIRPQQTLFKNRLEAIRNTVDFANSILAKNLITGNYSFDLLNKQEEIPNIYNREYDFLVEDTSALDDIDTINFRQATLTCTVLNGKIYTVNIIDAGFGYINPPLIKIVTTVQSSAELKAEIDSNGKIISVTIADAGSNFVDIPVLEVRPHSAIVQINSEYGNRWTKHSFDYSLRTWIRVKTQSYNTPLYWNFINWQDSLFDEYKNVKYIIDNLYELDTLTSILPYDYVKVKNNGQGRYIILEKTANNVEGNFSLQYNIVFSENGTIELLDTLWDYDQGKYAYDRATLEETLYDQQPDLELYYILTALKNDIFVSNLKVNWNLLFFSAVKYALTEQKLLDWAFKTSFINIQNNLGSLDQRPVYKLDNESYFESYIKEIKPYHTQIRNYTSKYAASDGIDVSITRVTDFDLPAYFDNVTEKFKTIEIESTVTSSIFTVTNTLTNVLPWKDWTDNYKFSLEEIKVAYGGSTYTQRPTVSITTATGDYGFGATADAYIRNGSVYKIIVTNPGQGYVIPPIVQITGGGPHVTSTATVSPILSNYTIRKNIIGMKFDRNSPHAEIVDTPVVDQFYCTGDQNKFTLSWLADHDKLSITPLLDGKLVLSADYNIEYYTQQYAGYNKKYSRFVFLNYVPALGQTFKITYKKSIDLFNAIDRIDKFYAPTENMVGKEHSMLMSGLEYPQTSIQGLMFNETPAWGTTPYDQAPWGDLVNTYAEAKLIEPLSINDTILQLNTTTGIEVGQRMSIITSSTSLVFRTDTVVESINTASNSITIFSPNYAIKEAFSTGTIVGSEITIKTIDNFNGNFRPFDIVNISGISTGGFNGEYEIFTCTNNTFKVTATSILSSSTAIVTTSSFARVFSILQTVLSTSTLLDTVQQLTTGTSTVFIETYALYSDVVTATFSSSVGSPTWSITTSTDVPPRARILVEGLTTTTNTQLDVNLYGYTNIEFWGNNTDYASLDTAIAGGSWTNTALSGALGINPEDIIIDGDSFINPNSSYAPEEFVPGHVMDSLGINVYTQPEFTSPVVVSTAIPVQANVITRCTLPILPDNPMGIMVYFNGTTFNQVSDMNFTSLNSFYLDGNDLVLPAQPISGRAFCTIITAGSNTQMDGNLVSVDNQISITTTTIVSSLLDFYDVKSVYVTLNGNQIFEYTGVAPGYLIQPTSELNNRASVKIILPLDYTKHTIEAWFFKLPYAKFNKFNEDNFTIGSTPTGLFTLNKPPSEIEPASAQAIVETGPTTMRRRLKPPSISYYKVRDSQTTFDIDNKNQSPNIYNLGNVKVYVNGVELRPGFDFVVNSAAETITIINNLLVTGDVVAVMSLIDYEYIIIGNQLYLTTPISNTTLKVTTFSDHDKMGLRTERFDINLANEYTLSLPALNENYIWVSAGSQLLIGGYEFTVLQDLKTIQINDWVEIDPTQQVIITTINPPTADSDIIGFRLFKDLFGRQHFKRLSKRHTATLESPLSYTDTTIYVTNGNTLAHPNPSMNIPGVILLDGERIEYFSKNGNALSQLRRGTLGTSPAFYSQIGTKVIDQSIKQTIQTLDNTYIQHIASSDTSTYTISTLTNTSSFSIDSIVPVGDGIVLSTLTNAVDQVEVYYGGRKLRKTSWISHDNTISFDTSTESLTILDPEFSIDISTQELTLNINEEIAQGTRISIVQRTGKVWSMSSESLLVSNISQAVFLRTAPAELPDSYYYGGPLEITDANSDPFTTDDGATILEGY